MRQIFLIGGLAFLVAQPAGAFIFHTTLAQRQMKRNPDSLRGAMPPKPAPGQHTFGQPLGKIGGTLPPVPPPPSKGGVSPGCRIEKPFVCVGQPASAIDKGPRITRMKTDKSGSTPQ